MPFSSYIMENVLFKISYPAEFHAQTAVEAALTLHAQLKARGKSTDDIKNVQIRTQEVAMRIINRKGKLHNFADREYVKSAAYSYPVHTEFTLLVTISTTWLPTL